MKPSLRLLLPPVTALVVCLWTMPRSGERHALGWAAESPADSVPAHPETASRGITQAASAAGGTPLPGPVWEGAQRVPTTADAVGFPGTAAPLPPDFLNHLASPSGKEARFSLPDGTTASGTVELLQSDENGVLCVQGRLETPAPGSYFFRRQSAPGLAGAMVGNVQFDAGGKAWRVDPSGPEGAPMLNPVRLDQVVCVRQPVPPPASPNNPAQSPPENRAASGTPQFVPQAHPANLPIPAEQNGVIPLQSLPGAAGVIYLDFDGEPGPFAGWGAVRGPAAPSGASNAQIMEVWQRVAEDYQIFSLNITTDRKVFDHAAATSRQHVVITPTSDAAPGAGGVALIGSFNWSGDTVCWSFARTGKYAAEAISHEVGHTLGLSHDGRTTPVEEYYSGQGSGEVGWAPIMGSGYLRNLTQWSRGEYAHADNSEDDLLIISRNNNSVDYRPDDTAGTQTGARYLGILPDFRVSNEGILETRNDRDAWRFQSAGGAASLTLTPVSAGPNTDLVAEIHDGANALIASSNPEASLGATVTAALAPGDYTLRVSGTGRGQPLADGYSSYGSLGAYLISGSVAGGVRPDRFSLAENSPNGTSPGSIAPRLDHGTHPLIFSITAGNAGGAFTVDAGTGRLSVAGTALLDYESLSGKWDDPAGFEWMVAITDPINPLLNESLRVVVTVHPVNEAPVLTGGEVTLFTRTRPGTPGFHITGSDPDRFDFPRFSILSGDPEGAFAIDPATGLISTTGLFPTAPPASPYHLTIRATDQGSPALTSEATVGITVLEAPAGPAPGGIMRTYFDNIPGSSVSSLTQHPRFLSNTPDSEELHRSFEGAGHGSSYGSTARGYLLPPATGSYTFWITSDDASELRLSPDASPDSAVVRATAPGPTGRYQYDRFPSQQSAAITLTAGQPYYIEARHKASSGGDHLAVAWQGPGISRGVISGAHLAPWLQSYPPRIAPRAFPVRRGSDPGTAIGTVRATDANLSATPHSYTITGGTAAAWCAIDATTGLLYVRDALALESAAAPSYTLTVRTSDHAVPGLTGSGTILLNPVAPTALRSPGPVQQIWTGIPGTTVASLTADPRYPYRPTSTRVLTNFDSGTGHGPNYGSRIRAMVIPPATGSYTFYLASNDESSLRFTTGPNFATAPQVASVASSTARRSWTAFASQRSTAFTLTAGQRYFMEVLHKNGGGEDFVQVAWTGPGLVSPTVIPAPALEAFDLNLPPSWSDTEYAFSVRQGAATGTPAGAGSAVDPESTGLVYRITAGNTGGAFVINPFTGTITVADSSALVPGQTFHLALRVQDDGIAGVYPFKTATSTAAITVQPGLRLRRPASSNVNLPAQQGLELQSLPSGRPGGTLVWSMASGPGTVTFEDAAAYHTGATFSAPGFYRLRATETASGSPLTVDCMVQSGSPAALPGGDSIGVPGPVPSHVWNAGTWQIRAGGGGLPAGPADSFYFINQPAADTVTITARITSVQNLSGHASMAGIMIRESAEAEARYVFCGLTSMNGRRLMLRTTAGLSALTAAADDPAAFPFAPLWVRLTRSGSDFTAWTAPDVSGTPGPFAPMGPAQTFPMASPCLAGLAASSGVPGSPGTSGIDHLTITPSLANLAPAVSAAGPSSIAQAATALLRGTVSDDNLPVFPGTTTSSWSQQSGPGTVHFGSPAAGDTSASFSLPGNYRLRLSADDGEVFTFLDLPLTVTGGQPMDLWRTNQFGPDASDPLIAGDTADPDKDGLANLLEYALALEPLLPGGPALKAEKVEIEGTPYLRLTVARNPSATDVQLVIETTTTPADPGSWSSSGTVPETDTPVTLRARTRQPTGTLPAQFLRLRVTR